MTLHFAENRTRHRRHNFGDSNYFMQDSGGSGGGGGGGGGGGRAGGDSAPVLGGSEKSDIQSGNLLYHTLQSGVGELIRGNWSGNSTVQNGPLTGSGAAGVGVAGAVGGGEMHSEYSHSSSASEHGYLFHAESHVTHDPEMEVAHKLHYASLAVVSVLLVEVSVVKEPGSAKLPNMSVSLTRISLSANQQAL